MKQTYTCVQRMVLEGITLRTARYKIILTQIEWSVSCKREAKLITPHNRIELWAIKIQIGLYITEEQHKPQANDFYSAAYSSRWINLTIIISYITTGVSSPYCIQVAQYVTSIFKTVILRFPLNRPQKSSLLLRIKSLR